MSRSHKQQKHVRPGRKIPPTRLEKRHGFAGLDPSKMGLDMPDWLAESPTTSVPQEPAPLAQETPTDIEPQLRTVLEGMKVVCICKGIKQRVFWNAMDEGAQTKEEINRLTGSGSGGCQGRRCGPRIMDMLRRRSS